MKILGLIPARGGSKGVPGKNIKKLNGKPLLQYTVEVAQKSKLLHGLIVSSDDEKIIAVAKDLGAEVPFIRPNNLALDSSPTIGVILHALTYFKSIGQEFDAVCLLQVTSPFRTVSFLDSALKKFRDLNLDSLVSVQEVPHEYNPHWVFKADENGELNLVTGESKIITRRQDLPKVFHRDGSIYLTKTSVLLEEKSLFGSKIGYIESPKDWYVNIDTPKDWDKAEKLGLKLKL